MEMIIHRYDPVFFFLSCVCSYAPIGKLHGLLDRWIRLRRSNQLRWLCVNQMKHKLKMMSVLSLKTVMVVILKVCFYLIASHVAVPLPLQPKCCLHPRRIRAITQSPHFLLRLSLQGQLLLLKAPTVKYFFFLLSQICSYCCPV